MSSGLNTLSNKTSNKSVALKSKNNFFSKKATAMTLTESRLQVGPDYYKTKI